MCGIFGYRGEGDTAQILMEGISKLDYRGYDSVGFATLSNGSIVLQKAVGKIKDIKKKIALDKLKGKIGIAHTRWSTHGIVNEENAHPHLSCDKKIAIVHNGIIENFQQLKDLLQKKGHSFTSETDSEVLAHLIEEERKTKNLREAVMAILPKLRGRYALGVMEQGGNELIGVRKGSPLIVGVGKDETFLSSDVNAFLEHTNKSIILDDDEIVFIEEGVSVQDFSGKKISKKIQNIDASALKAELGRFPHYMLKEIYEQPKTVENTLRHVTERVKQLNLQPFNRVVLLACGTAYYACLIGSYYFEKFLRISVDVQYASEFRYRNPVVDKKTLIISVSQSGETADTLAAVREAKEKGAYCITICNVKDSTLARESDFLFHTQAGTEIGVASTKAFTSQVLTLLVMSMYFTKHKEDYKRDQMIVMTNELFDLPKLIQKVLVGFKQIDLISSRYSSYHNFLFLGRGYLYPIALEGALKLKEISYIHAEGQSAAELKHGPIALIDDEMPSVFLCLKDNLYDKVMNNMQEVKSRGGKIIAIATEGDKEIEKIADDVIFIPRVSDFLSPIVAVIPLQIMAYIVALRRGLDIDKPRNLAKVVTVE